MVQLMVNLPSTNKKSFSEKDEYYTPRILAEAILPYVSKDKIVWCPWDTEGSEFVRMFRENGNKVMFSHIWCGQDFLTYEPDEPYDCIVSNPPFTKKIEVFDRLYKLGKPFAVLCGLPILNYQEIGSFFLDKDLQLLIVDKKVSFDGKTASFNNSFFCRNMLPRDLMFCHLEHNNSGINYVPSHMYEEEIEGKEAGSLWG